jgi:Luciferase-like monooxygenase
MPASRQEGAQRRRSSREATKRAQWAALEEFTRQRIQDSELSAMALAEYTGGRFVLGLGTAPKEWNEKWHGLDYGNPVKRMREYVECIRAMWSARPDHPVDFSGQFYKVRRIQAPDGARL